MSACEFRCIVECLHGSQPINTGNELRGLWSHDHCTCYMMTNGRFRLERKILWTPYLRRMLWVYFWVLYTTCKITIFFGAATNLAVLMWIGLYFEMTNLSVYFSTAWGGKWQRQVRCMQHAIININMIKKHWNHLGGLVQPRLHWDLKTQASVAQRVNFFQC